MKTTVVWFYHDLRLSDNPALYYAAQRGAVVPVYIYAPKELGQRAPGAARQWWLHHSLQAFDRSLQQRGLKLIIHRAAQSLPVLEQILTETGADALYWNTRYEPQLWERDERIRKILQSRGIEVREFPCHLLHDPDAVRTDSGQPYGVFTPFWKRLLQTTQVPEPLPAPETLRAPERLRLGPDGAEIAAGSYIYLELESGLGGAPWDFFPVPIAWASSGGQVWPVTDAQDQTYAWGISQWGIHNEQDLRVFGDAMSRRSFQPQWEKYRAWVREVGDDGVVYVSAGYSALGHLLHYWMGVEGFAYALADVGHVKDSIFSLFPV